MVQRVISVFLVYFLVLNVCASEFSVKKRLNYIKSELTKITNDETKTKADYIHFIDNEIHKIDTITSPYDNDFTPDELSEIKDYLLKVKTVFEQKETEENAGILSTIWDWLVSASPYIAFGASVIGAFFLGRSFSGSEDGDSSNTPSLTEKKPTFGKTFFELSKCLDGVQPKGSNISWSPNSKFIAYGDGAGKIYVCNILTDERVSLMTYKYAPLIKTIVWDQTGKYISTARDSGPVIKTWDVETGKLKSETAYVGPFINQIGWSPYKKYFSATTDENRILLWETSLSHPYPAGGANIRPVSQNKDVLSHSWSPDGNYIVGGGGNSYIEVWDVSNQKKVSSIMAHPKYFVTSVIWAPDNHIVSTASNGNIKIWKISSTERIIFPDPLFSFKGHNISIWKTFPSPKRKYFISAGESHPVLKIWEVKSGKLLSSIKEKSGIDENSISWSPDGKYIAFRLKGKKSLKIYSVTLK